MGRLNEELGILLRLERVQRGWTQKQVGEILGLNEKTVAEWERRGLPATLGKVEELLKHFGLELKVRRIRG